MTNYFTSDFHCKVYTVIQITLKLDCWKFSSVLKLFIVCNLVINTTNSTDYK